MFPEIPYHFTSFQFLVCCESLDSQCTRFPGPNKPPVLCSPLITNQPNTSNKNHQKTSCSTSKQSLEVFITAWVSCDSFHSFLYLSLGLEEARKRPGRVDYPESPGGDLLTFPNASSRDVFWCGCVGWEICCWMMLDDFFRSCAVYCFHTASHVSVWLPLSVPEVKKLQRQNKPFHMLKALLGGLWFLGIMFTSDPDEFPPSASAILTQLGMFQPDVRMNKLEPESKLLITSHKRH